jgi:hypothetical protein
VTEYHSIRIDSVPWRALLDHFLAKTRVYRLVDEFGYEPAGLFALKIEKVA